MIYAPYDGVVPSEITVMGIAREDWRGPDGLQGWSRDSDRFRGRDSENTGNIGCGKLEIFVIFECQRHFAKSAPSTRFLPFARPSAGTPPQKTTTYFWAPSNFCRASRYTI